jgi:hypothetical protein
MRKATTEKKIIVIIAVLLGEDTNLDSHCLFTHRLSLGSGGGDWGSGSAGMLIDIAVLRSTFSIGAERKAAFGRGKGSMACCSRTTLPTLLLCLCAVILKLGAAFVTSWWSGVVAIIHLFPTVSTRLFND